MGDQDKGAEEQQGGECLHFPLEYQGISCCVSTLVHCVRMLELGVKFIMGTKQ